MNWLSLFALYKHDNALIGISGTLIVIHIRGVVTVYVGHNKKKG